MRVSEKTLQFFKNRQRLQMLPENATELVRFSKRSKFEFFQKIDGIFERKIWHFEKLLELAKLRKNATGKARILKRFKVKKLGF